MKVFIAEKLSQCGINSLKDSKHTVVEKFVNGDALTEALTKEQPQVLVVRSTKVTSAMMDAAPSIELIVRAGAGFDNIDVKGASRRCIYVANCPGKNSAAVAELAIGLMLSLDRQIPSNVIDARAGRWEKAKYSDAQGLKSKTLGLVGLGNIGKEVVKRAKGLEMNVVAWSRSLTPEIASSLGVTLLNSPLEVAAQSDIVSLHVAANADTKHLANKGFFEAMKPKSLFINTTRGNVVDESALSWALDNKGIRAGLDVFEGEPAAKSGDYQIEIAKHPSVYITHHIGASTDQAQDETAMEAARIINVFASTSVVDNCVNIQKTIPGTCLLTVRHLDKVGVLASVLNELRRANYNVQQMENIVFQGSEAACARIRYLPEAYGSSPREGDVIRNIQGIEFVLSAYVTMEYDLCEPSNKKQRTQ